MSISSEIARISGNVSDSLTAVASKGITVPSGSNSDDLPGLIAQIPDNYSVTLSLTGASSSATGTKVVSGGSYFTEITPTTAGHKISSITVTMGGLDITSQVFKPGVGAKAITANGTYNASADNLSGYSSVVVNVSGGGGGGSVIVSDTTDSHGGTIRTITSTDEVHLQTKTITPTSSSQTVLPDTGYDGFSSVVVEAGGGGATYTRTVIAPQQTVTPTNNGTYLAATLNTSAFVQGEHYIITYNGTEYLFTCAVLWGTNYLLGDINYFWGTTGLPYPFGILWERGTTCSLACGDSTAVTVKIEHIELS